MDMIVDEFSHNGRYVRKQKYDSTRIMLRMTCTEGEINVKI